ncbi:MAG: hypothetical protein KDC79_06960 [Cyclobacteriaceae bacterium]|nr:hypothetical protein [Cyclobacteriaceae bacterium]
MIRKILSIISGYAIFVLTSIALFRISGQNPHADPTIWFAVFTLIYGVFSSFIAGFLTRLIAKTTDLKINYVLALIIAGFATFSLFKTEGNHWTQLLAIFILAPASIFGGLVSLKRIKK